MKRGQLSIFVIIGLVILLAILLFFIIRKPTTVALPPKLAPVEMHVRDCLQFTTIQALKELASHGGYITLPQQLVIKPLDPTESDAIVLNPLDNESAVPYWYYLAGSNHCRICHLTTLTPTVEEMERDVRSYILGHLHECINYGLFPDITVTAAPEQDVTVTFTKEGVLVDYKRLLTLQRDATKAKIDHVTARVDIPIKRYYEIAKQITQREINTQFLENYLLYLVSAYGGIHADLPPLGGYEESFNPSFWVLPTVQQRFQQLVQSITPSLQVLGTKGVQPLPNVQDQYVRGFLNTMRLNLLNGMKADDLRITIFAPNQPLFLDVKPRDGLLIKPESERQSGILFVPPRQQNYYNFFYDISAPFLIEIRHENATAGTDISFLFALEANLRDNKNMAEWLLGHGTIPWSRDFVAYRVTKLAAPTTPQQTPSQNPAYSYTAYSHNASLHSLFCDDTFKTTPLSVRVWDGASNKPLADVQFSFQCGSYGSCSLGWSDEDEFGIYQELKTKAPPCLGGFLKAEKQGYQARTVKVSTRGQPVTLSPIFLYPYHKVNVTFVKRRVSRNALGALTLGPEEPLDTNDTVFVTFTRRSDDGGVPVTTTTLQDATTTPVPMRLVPGVYEVRGFFFTGKRLTIPKGCKRIHHHDIPNKDVVLKPPVPWGGVELSNQTRLWDVHGELYQHDTLKITLFEAPPPRCLDDLENMDAARTYTRRWMEEALPTLE